MRRADVCSPTDGCVARGISGLFVQILSAILAL